MRLGAPIFAPWDTPQQWAEAVRQAGYSAAYCPVDEAADRHAVRAFLQAAERADVVIAEVGAWSNPISPDRRERREAMALCQARLALADRIGARCCVNIAGSRARRWDGPHPDNLSEETFDLIVETVRRIIDGVRPARTFYTLETMPWVFPDNPDSYLALLRAVDRERFGAHLDPVNLVNCPRRCFDTGGLLEECFRKLGPHIRSCHGKDIALSEELTVHLSEVPPGTGMLDYGTFLRELDRLDPDTPLMLEHLEDAGQYAAAAEHVRSTADRVGVEPR